MNKSKKLKSKTAKLLVKNLIVLAVLVAVTVVGVRSWFTTTSSANAAGIAVKTEVPQGMEVAIVAPGATPNAGDWKDSTTISLTPENFSFLDSLNMTQVTGNGITFISPYLMQDGGVAIVDDSSTWASDKIATNANGVTDYLSFDLYMRTQDSGKKVVLNEDTYCGPLDAAETFAGTTLNSNSVIGAVRFAACSFSSLSATTPNARKLLWIPAPHIYYAYDTIWTADDAPTTTIKNNLVSTSNTYGLPTSRNTSTNALTYEYASTYNGTYKHTYWTYNPTTGVKGHSTVAYGTNKASNVTANTKKDYKLHSETDLATLSNTSTVSGKTYYQNKVRINVWIEGEDPEARAAQVAGEFKLSMILNLKNA